MSKHVCMYLFAKHEHANVCVYVCEDADVVVYSLQMGK